MLYADYINTKFISLLLEDRQGILSRISSLKRCNHLVMIL